MSGRTDEYGYALDRDKQRRYANIRGFYWLPCALCGFYRGGHEVDGEFSIPIKGEAGISRMVCRRHPDAASEFVYVRAHVEPAPEPIRSTSSERES